MTPILSAKFAPATISWTPSPVMSGIAATEMPRRAPPSASGSVRVRITEPSAPEISKTSPESVFGKSPSIRPTATSGTVSPSMSPSAASDCPNRSFVPSWTLRMRDISAPEKNSTLPVLAPPPSPSRGAPTAISGTLSELISPRPATDQPK